jgi:hypothetical protein
MYSIHYFVEKTIKERQKQFWEEAKRLHLLEAVNSSEAKNRKRVFGLTRRYFKDHVFFPVSFTCEGNCR